MEDEGFLYNDEGFKKEWNNGQYCLIGNTGKNIQSIQLPQGINSVALLYGNANAVSLQGRQLSVFPGNIVAIKFCEKKQPGLYKNGVQISYLKDISFASVEGKTSENDIFFAVYSEEGGGAEELLYLKKNPSSVDLSRWQKEKVRIRIFSWKNIVPTEKVYKGHIE